VGKLFATLKMFYATLKVLSLPTTAVNRLLAL